MRHVLWSMLLLMTSAAIAHENWISNNKLRNSVGEWCCGAHDCKSYAAVGSTSLGWLVDGELVLFDEALPVVPPDGKVTICRRPDGSRRCVIGVKPGF